jgi:SAM-dependent methyltransferase
MQQIKFKSEVVSSKNCPVCQCANDESFAHIISNDYVFGVHETDDFLIKCKGCSSVFYLNTKVVGYLGGEEADHKKFTDHYFLVGCGIDLGVELLATYGQGYESLLEVGCGAGFSVAYWDKFKNKRALGLEAAYYGDIGRQVFDIDVRNSYIQADGPPIGKFDVVMSTEVIEHVENPSNFIAALKNNLAEDGVLILTTPAAEYVNAEGNRSMLLAALSPGFHYFLLSESAMKELLKENGFTNVEIKICNERLIACAKINSKKINKGLFDRNDYIEYLGFLAKNTATIISEGAQVKLFKEFVNNGDFQKAEAVLPELLAMIRDKYRLDLSLLISSYNVSQGRESLVDYLYNLPPYIGILLYYMGLFYSRRAEDMINKLLCFGLAYQLLSSITSVAPQFAQESESLIPLAGGEFANALLDNTSYFHGYALGKNTGIAGDFVDPMYMVRLQNKIQQAVSSDSLFPILVNVLKIKLAKICSKFNFMRAIKF